MIVCVMHAHYESVHFGPKLLFSNGIYGWELYFLPYSSHDINDIGIIEYREWLSQNDLTGLSNEQRIIIN